MGNCDVNEPAGMACCCCVPNVLTEVAVDTASSGQPTDGGGINHELSLVGLKHPREFKEAVWAMKRAQKGSGGSFAPAQHQMTQNSSGETAQILKDIRDDLREMKELLKTKTKP